MDATIIRSFQAELFSRFVLSSYTCHVNLAAAEPWLFMPKWKDGSTVEFIIFHVQDFLFQSIMSNIMRILKSGAVGYDVTGVYRWILPKC